MHLIFKIGLAVLAGAAVLVGINQVEKNSHESNFDNKDFSKEDDISITDIPTGEETGSKKSKFMKNLNTAQHVVERTGRIITGITRIFENVNDIFSDRCSRNYYNGYEERRFTGTTIII